MCQSCGEKTGNENQNICGACLKKIKKRVPPFCIKCGKSLEGALDSREACSDCKDTNPFFDKANSVFYYNGIMKKLVHNFKYQKMTTLSKEFGNWISSFIKQDSIEEDYDLILSIPMHSARLLKREINPSHILGRNLSKKLGVPYSGKILKKIKNTPAQTGLKRNERIDNIKESFSVRKNRLPHVASKNILLVDDLFTTGSTVNECAKALKENGAKNIQVITLARGDAKQ